MELLPAADVMRSGILRVFDIFITIIFSLESAYPVVKRCKILLFSPFVPIKCKFKFGRVSVPALDVILLIQAVTNNSVPPQICPVIGTVMIRPGSWAAST